MCFAPGFHDKGIIDSNARYHLNTFSFQVCSFLNIARQMSLQQNKQLSSPMAMHAS